MNDPVRDRLIRAAQGGELVYYSELAKLLGIDMDNPHFGVQVGRVLDEINQDEVADGRPMLSAIVVSKDTMLPGKGFFTLGQQLRRTLRDNDEISCALREMKRIHEYWSKEALPSP
jgi:hypothetical protein